MRRFLAARRRGQAITRFCVLLFLLFYSLPAFGDTGRDVLTAEDIRESLYCSVMITDTAYLVAGDRGYMFRSEDAGNSWKQVASGVRVPLFSVSFPDSKHGWISGKGGLILHSSDGGMTWRAQPHAGRSHLFSISFADTRRGCAVGDWGAVVATSDGGATWTDATLEEDVNLYAVVVTETGLGHMVGEYGRIFRTEDGGLTWAEIDSPAEETMFCLSRDGTSWFAAGLDGVILVSMDDGQSWDRIETGVIESFYDIQVRGDVGWAVGDVGTVFHTTDGGRNWRHVDVPTRIRLSWIGALSLSERSGMNGFAAGANGLYVGIQEGKLIW